MSIYGILISLAFLVCLLIGEKRTKLDKQDTNTFWNLSLITIVSGILGARIYHAIDFWEYYQADPSKIFFFWNGGLGIWGGIVAAAVSVLAYSKIKRIKAGYWLDLMASVLPLGQAIGRWGNYFNQENFGVATNLPWGISIDKFPSLKFHPLFLYESILNLLLFVALIKVQRNNGKVTILYLLGYSLIRSLLEFIKYDPWKINGLNVAQFVSVAVVAVTLPYAIHIIRPRRF